LSAWGIVGKKGGMKQTKYIPVQEASRRIGLPLAWLKREASEGRVPALRVGRRWFVDAEETERALATMASGGATR
jgi:hypothetical protein